MALNQTSVAQVHVYHKPFSRRVQVPIVYDARIMLFGWKGVTGVLRLAN